MTAICSILAVALSTFGFWIAAGSLPAILGAIAFSTSFVLTAQVAAVAQRERRMAGMFNLARVVPQLALTAGLAWCMVRSDSELMHVWNLTSWLQLGAVLVLAIYALALFRAPRTTAGLMRLSLSLAPPALLTFFATQVDILVGTLVLPTEDLAFFSIAVAFRLAISTLGMSAGQRWYSDKSASHSTAIPPSYFREALITSAVPALALAALAPWAIPAFYGNDFRSAIVPSVILAVSGVIKSIDLLYWYDRLGYVSNRSLLVARFAPSAAVLGLGGLVMFLPADDRLIYLSFASVAGTLLGVWALRRTHAEVSR